MEDRIVSQRIMMGLEQCDSPLLEESEEIVQKGRKI